MAIYNLIGGTASKLNITLYGGYEDVVTLTNVRNGQKYENINLGSSMKKEIEIRSGTYSISSTHLSSTKVSLPDIEIKKDVTSINIYPKGAIFWYGNGDADGERLGNKCGGLQIYDYYYPESEPYKGYLSEIRQIKTYNDALGFYAHETRYDTSEPWGNMYDLLRASMNMVNSISYSGFSKLKIKSTSTGGAFYTTNSKPSNNPYPYVDKKAPNSSGSVISLTPASYLAFYCYTSGDGSVAKLDVNLKINAIWLE